MAYVPLRKAIMRVHSQQQTTPTVRHDLKHDRPCNSQRPLPIPINTNQKPLYLIRTEGSPTSDPPHLTPTVIDAPQSR